MRLGFTGSPLDRGEMLRRDPDALAAAAADPAARWMRLDALRPVMDTAGEAPCIVWSQAPTEREGEVLLGLNGGAPRFAVAGAAVAPERAIDARAAAMTCPGEDAAIIAQARSLLDWHARHRFCANCASPTVMARGGQLRRCPRCGEEHYPAVAPVVIMLVTAGERALIARGARMPPGFLSALAGFVEPGESIEEAVAREVLEEVGVRVDDVRYVASQPWPFPSQLMLGCTARARSTELVLEPSEIEQARWVTRLELKAAFDGVADFAVPPPLAIARDLMRMWLETD